MPKVSVIIPTYNRSALVREAIASVLSQSHKDLELIVVDDGTDDTGVVVGAISDGRIRYFYKQYGGGLVSARNFGLSKANGQYVAFLDSDDLWPPDFLEVMVFHLEQRTDCGVAYSPVTLLRSDTSVIKSYKKPAGKSGWITQDLFKTGFVWPSAALIRKSVLENIWFDESLKKSYEDGDFFLRLSTHTQFLFVEDVEAIKTEHTSNLSAQVGVQPTRILVLERFYFRLGGDKLIPAPIAMRKISHAYRKVAEARRQTHNRSAAIVLYKSALSYYPLDIRLYWGLFMAFLLSKKSDKTPNWKMPDALPEPPSSKPGLENKI
jgi:glycosyltransferase involved in cell wall biosynthesis